MTTTPSEFKRPNPFAVWGPRIVVYIILSAFAFLMLFPFTYMMMTSFKNSRDVFHSPPRLLPYSDVTRTYTIQEQVAEIGGDDVLVRLTDEQAEHAFFAAPNGINPSDPRASLDLVNVPVGEATPNEAVLSFTNPFTGSRNFILPYQEAVSLTDPLSGNIYTFPLYTLNDQTVALAYEATVNKYVSPENPEAFIWAEAERTANVFNFDVDGQVYELVPSGRELLVGFFTTPELLNPVLERESEIVERVALEDAVETGEQVFYAITPEGARQVTAEEAEELEGQGVDIEDYDLYEVVIGDETQTLVRAYNSRLQEFINPDDPSIVQYDTPRTSGQIEVIDFQFENYNTVLGLNLDRALINTVLVTLGVTLGQLVTSIFGGYAFSRIEFPGRNMIFILYLGSIMIPFVVLIIPMYRLMVELGWENRIVSLIVPWIFTAYGTFLMRQFFITIPKEIEEAALLDGCSRFRILWTIFVPLSMPAVATQAIFTFLYAWNSFLWPLLIIGEGNERNHVLTLSLIRLSNIANNEPNLVMTGAAIAILPPIIVFILAQKYFIESVTSSAVKG